MGSVFRFFRQSGSQVRKIYLCDEWINSYTFDINTLKIQLSRCWIGLALGHIVYIYQFLPSEIPIENPL